MITIELLNEYTKKMQTSPATVLREYSQHAFLASLYNQEGSDRLLFKGGTALRIVLKSPRFSEDLDFTGSVITQQEIETYFAEVLGDLEQQGIPVRLETAKETSGGYLGKADIELHGISIRIKIEVSLGSRERVQGVQTQIVNRYIPDYSLIHLPVEEIVQGKLAALLSRHKPRDFYDYFYLLSSGKYPSVREEGVLKQVLQLLDKTEINFRGELKEFLPSNHALMLRDFKTTLKQKIEEFL